MLLLLLFCCRVLCFGLYLARKYICSTGFQNILIPRLIHCSAVAPSVYSQSANSFRTRMFLFYLFIYLYETTKFLPDTHTRRTEKIRKRNPQQIRNLKYLTTRIPGVSQCVIDSKRKRRSGLRFLPQQFPSIVCFHKQIGEFEVRNL